MSNCCRPAKLPQKVVANTVLTGGHAVVTQTDSSVVLTLPVAEQAQLVTAVRLELDASLSPQYLFDKVDDAK